MMQIYTITLFIDLCINQLLSMFPHVPKEELVKEYHASNNDINRTISSILGDTDFNGEMIFF